VIVWFNAYLFDVRNWRNAYHRVGGRWRTACVGLLLLAAAKMGGGDGDAEQTWVVTTQCESINAKLLSLSAYFERTWICGDFPPSLWTHYDNNGPRTTNVAEGWHSSLNSQFGVPHPSLRVFLHWLQQCQFQVQSRAMQLTAGRSPKPRKKEYIQVDSDLWAAI